jgi:hypothetical protein
MRVAAVALLVASILAHGACSSGPARPEPGPKSAAAQPWERDPYTRTSQIEIDGNPVGYLVEYQPIPAGSGVSRQLPTGSYRIQDRRLEDIGFISPRGDVRRYVAGGSESIGSWSLEEGILRFFGGGRRARFFEIEPAVVKPAAPEPAKTEKAEGEAGEEGEAKDEGAGGGS